MKIAYEHPESRRDVVLLDGFVMSREEAVSKGYTVSAWPYKGQAGNVAIRHPHRAVEGLVVLQHGVTVSEWTARTLGYIIIDAKPVAQAAPLSPHRAWRSSIIASPEAKDRPDATAELVLSQSETTMSVDAARAFLRGLPVETEHTEHTEEGTMTTDSDPKAARLAEIEGSMRAFNASRGDAVKPTQGAVDPAKVQRLAEIRFNAMMQNGKAHTTEAKKLKLALDTNTTMGTAIDVALAQVGFDVNSLFVTR